MRKCILKMFTVLSAILIFSGCFPNKMDTTHKVEVDVKPMQITIDVNLKVDKQLDNFFDDIDKQDETKKLENENEK